MIHPLRDWQKVKRGYRFGVKTFYSNHHLGVDYIIPENTPIYAPINCQIIVSGNFPQGGNTIHVAFDDTMHGKLILRCMHLCKLMEKGNYKEGDIIGYSGNTGNYSTAPHLHLDLSKNKVDLNNFNNFIDPDEYFISKISNNLKLENMKLIKNPTSQKIYAIGADDKKHWIINEESFNVGREMGLWGDWNTIENVGDDKYAEGHTLILVK